MVNISMDMATAEVVVRAVTLEMEAVKNDAQECDHDRSLSAEYARLNVFLNDLKRQISERKEDQNNS